jgi:hypothetical protein
MWRIERATSRIDIEGTIMATDPDTIRHHLTEYWWHLFTALFDAYPDGDWDALETTLWANSGRIITYPYRWNEPFVRNERVCIQVAIHDLEWHYRMGMEHPDPLQQDQVETQIVQQYWTWLITAADAEPTRTLLAPLKSMRRIPLYAYEEHPVAGEHHYFTL